MLHPTGIELNNRAENYDHVPYFSEKGEISLFSNNSTISAGEIFFTTSFRDIFEDTEIVVKGVPPPEPL